MANITVLDLDFESITVNLPFSQGRKTLTSSETDEDDGPSLETNEDDASAMQTDDTGTEELLIDDDSTAPKGALVGVFAVVVVLIALVALIKRRRGGEE